MSKVGSAPPLVRSVIEGNPPLPEAVPSLEGLGDALSDGLYVVSREGVIVQHAGPDFGFTAEALAALPLPKPSTERPASSTSPNRFRRPPQTPAHAPSGHAVVMQRTHTYDNGDTLYVLRDVSEETGLRYEISSTLEYMSILSAEHHALEESIPNAHVLLASDGSVLAFNQAARELFGYDLDDILSKDSSVLATDARAWLALQAKCSEPKKTIIAELVGVRRDGETFPMSVTVSLVVAPSETYRSTIIQDLTEHYKRQRTLEDARERAEAATRAKSEFLANMSHEIRTPMNGVIGMLSLLLDSKLNEQQRDSAQTAHDSAQLLLTIINDILDFSKIEAGQLTIDATIFSIQALIQGALDLVQPQITAKGLELKADLRSDLALSYRGDEGRIRQILLNFLSNAIKFTAKGRISLTAEVKEDHVRDRCRNAGKVCQGCHLIRFSVRDQGIGIPEDRLEHIFGQFTQAESSTTRRFGGTGLGLAISKQLAILMQGNVGVQSAPGEGSTFWLEIPLPTASQAVQLKTAAATPNDKRYGARILLVEDNPVNQKVAARLLARLGCDVEIAVNGKLGVEAAHAGSFDLVFMDCQMPEMDGYEATRALRDLEATSKLPIVAMTANAMTGDREKCLDSGMNDFLTKPIAVPQLAAMLEKWIGRGDEANAD